MEEKKEKNKQTRTSFQSRDHIKTKTKMAEICSQCMLVDFPFHQRYSLFQRQSTSFMLKHKFIRKRKAQISQQNNVDVRVYS